MSIEKVMGKAQVLLARGRALEAAACFDYAERLGAEPDQCAARRWTCYMLAGNYESAWQQSDAIRARGAADAHRVWDGAPLTGSNVMVRSVHGFGDAIQMLRYTPLIRRQAARLTIQVAPQLVELVRGAAEIDEVVAWGEERPFDVQCEITELPYIFRSTLQTLPSKAPYLQLAAQSVTEARGILGEKSRPRVGLVWSSSAWDSTRFLPFHLLTQLIDAREDCDFWCLQPNAPEWAALCRHRGWPIRDAGNYATTTFAACVAEMDLVITVDSFAAHVAGALGRPAWLLLKQQADWRWMIERDDSPWYPSLQLFRQQAQGAWLPVVRDAAHALAGWPAQASTGKPASSLVDSQ